MTPFRKRQELRRTTPSRCFSHLATYPQNGAMPAQVPGAISIKGPLARIRRICLALPETQEQESYGHATFRFRKKVFVMFMNNHHGDGRVAIWCKSTPDAQKELVASDPVRFFVPPYVGPRLDRNPSE